MRDCHEPSIRTFNLRAARQLGSIVATLEPSVRMLMEKYSTLGFFGHGGVFSFRELLSNEESVHPVNFS